MSNKLILAAAALAAISFASSAEAAPSWHLSPAIGNVNGFCNGNGITTQVGYYGELTPHTGDNPDSALVVTVTAGCGPVTVAPSFNFPAGVEQDKSQAVECYRKRNGVVVGTPNACSTDAIWPNDWNVPNMFGWSYLAAGETLEIYVPISYAQRTSNAQFTSVVYNNFSPLGPTVTFAIDYEPRFSNFSVLSARGIADISLQLEHFHESAQVFVDYGTTPSFGSTTAAVTTDPALRTYDTITMPRIGGIVAGTTYYYRVRLVLPGGATYTSSTQQFQMFVPPCRRFC